MQLGEILSASRIVLDPGGTRVRGKSEVLRLVAELMATAVGGDTSTVARLLEEREGHGSTGIGDGVAIPHAYVDSAPGQTGALVLCPRGVAFDSVDGLPVRIIFGLVGPRRQTGEHLKVLARVSRFLRDAATREQLLSMSSPEAVIAVIKEQPPVMR